MTIITRRRSGQRQQASATVPDEPEHTPGWRRWAAGLRINRRGVQVALGVLWLIDGALQLQPFMFSPAFSTNVLGAAGSGQPGWVSAVVGVFAHQVAAHPIAWNAGFAATQLALGVGLLVPRLVRPALVASLLWATAVWWVGEGFGGLLMGHASLVTGAPGAAALYAILAVAAWPRSNRRADVERLSEPPDAVWFPFAWLVIWLGSVAFQLLPGQNRAGDLSAEISGNASGLLAYVGNAAAHAVDVGGAPLFVILLALMAAVAIGALRAGRCRTASAVIGIGLAFLFWMVGQDFGQVDSGRATDLNSGPLLIVMGLVLLSSSRRRTLADPHARSIAPGPEGALPPSFRRRLSTPAAGFAAVAVVTVLATVGAAARTATQAQAGAPLPDGMSMTAVMPVPATSQVVAGPSASARMVCSSEIRGDVATILGLRTPPATAATFVQHIYTCTYRLPNGALVVSVDDAPDRASARAHFTSLNQRLGSTRSLTGLASLGLPAFETTSGVVAFLKDDKTLEVDASAIPGQTDAARGTASDLAYTVATDILGCWTGG